MILKCTLQMWFLVLFVSVICNYALDTSDLVIVILSQANEYHARMAENSKYSIEKEVNILNKKPPIIYLSHSDFSLVGDWTIIPLVPQLTSLHASNASWFIFIEDRTEIRVEKLLAVLNKYNHNEDIWLGYALHDDEATIIHHFAFYKNPKSFKYPNIACGFAMSTKLLQKVSNKMKRHTPNPDFSIDNSHELALYIWEDGGGTTLSHEVSFCISDASFCSTLPQVFNSCDNPVSTETMYFAVKTCSKFHYDRIPVVKKTWALHLTKINFFSDFLDKDIPTINLGIPNTDSGHCAKTFAILKYARDVLKNDSTINWVILADDDTLFSIPRLQKLLTCYDPTSPIALGERYGYNALKPEGYNYLTGGGGIVFSRTLIELLSEPGVCECPTISSPDDMYLGICIAKIGADLIHSPSFHQARPTDYAKDYLKTQMAVSFHKHWNVNPFSVYEDWLLDADIIDDSIRHVEL